jgi:hypothetical protein
MLKKELIPMGDSDYWPYYLTPMICSFVQGKAFVLERKCLTHFLKTSAYALNSKSFIHAFLYLQLNEINNNCFNLISFCYLNALEQINTR